MTHEIVLRFRGNDIGLSCKCLRLVQRGRPGYAFIESRSLFPAAEVVETWRAWHEREGIAL